MLCFYKGKHYFYICILLNLLQFSDSLVRDEGWHNINLHCRDNDNKPVDWWYIYKAPGATAYGDSGRNFSYITATTPGRWKLSERLITSNNMLLDTIAPMFRSTYVDYMAYIVFESRPRRGKKHGSNTRSVLMADQLGGLFITHTVPGLINVNSDRPYFPMSELTNGHLISCTSVTIQTLNSIAISMRVSGARITAMQIPSSMTKVLNTWVALYKNSDEESWPRPLSSTVDFLSKEETLRAYLSVRRPGQKLCLYKTFARKKSVVLDVYAPSSSMKNATCYTAYSVRNIPAISVKIKDNPVLYIDSKADKSKFAVTTAAHWQRLGQGSEKFWSCTGDLEKDDVSGNGGILFCVENFEVWSSFDNLKIAEPKC